MRVVGDTVTIHVSGKVLVMSSGTTGVLPRYNEYTLTEGRALTEGIHSFTDDTDINTGLHNLIYPWIACFDPAGSEVDVFIFTKRPKNFQCIVDASGTITQLVLYPGNGIIYGRNFLYANLTQDSNADLIPDFLDSSLPGSITKVLQIYDFQKVFYVSSDDYFYVSSDGYTLEAIR
ncbi:hypothetical protein MSHOH_1460 [Methanosarcina horonobensis HB-1 = JCM 15518]|uniref:Uncharacterized protein n=1 Tax=Methanosarcina horonobensis HB-1 = JCM 15518 TaxID=1434110 RepID=A0A0E3SEK7_9EURY|nr:hypothetical protein MSHOH_1460 [Methanosarcina horonobensis HB-1 = JCM 15518]